MMYLKRYKLFESDINNDLIKNIEETFYDISDNLKVKVLIGGSRILTTKEFQFAGKICSDMNIDGYLFRQYIDNIVKVSIYKGGDDGNGKTKLFSYNDIKDNLEFAVGYLTSELGLVLDGIFIYNYEGGLDLPFTSYYRQNLKNIDINNNIMINLLFNIQKSAQNLV